MQNIERFQLKLEWVRDVLRLLWGFWTPLFTEKFIDTVEGLPGVAKNRLFVTLITVHFWQKAAKTYRLFSQFKRACVTKIVSKFKMKMKTRINARKSSVCNIDSVDSRIEKVSSSNYRGSKFQESGNCGIASEIDCRKPNPILTTWRALWRTR